jgi:hypothetical protein
MEVPKCMVLQEDERILGVEHIYSLGISESRLISLIDESCNYVRETYIVRQHCSNASMLSLVETCGILPVCVVPPGKYITAFLIVSSRTGMSLAHTVALFSSSTVCVRRPLSR